MNVSEYIVNELLKKKLDTVFSVTGGGSMYLNDAFGKNRKFKCIYMHHEQSCSMAADVYARIKKKPAVVCVTTGPGGINAINGVFGAYTDSTPMIKKKKRLRQLGDQENDIIHMVKKITKKSILIKKKEDLFKNLSSLIKESISGRPGPIWIDIPIDIQGEKLK